MSHVSEALIAAGVMLFLAAAIPAPAVIAARDNELNHLGTFSASSPPLQVRPGCIFRSQGGEENIFATFFTPNPPPRAEPQLSLSIHTYDLQDNPSTLIDYQKRF